MNSLGTDTVIFLPDEYLAKNIARETGKHIIVPTRLPSGNIHFETDVDYQMVGWNGRCEVHEQFTVGDIDGVRSQFPDVSSWRTPSAARRWWRPLISLAALTP